MRPRLALSVFFLFGLLMGACDRGCHCDGDDPIEPSDVDLNLPETTAELAREYARHFPLGTHGVLILRSFGDLSTTFQAIKERLRPIFDLGAVESEIRNTFGVDLHRRVTFREVGVAYDTGFALGYLRQQPVLAVFLIDPEPFLAHAQVVLRRQPFNLRAPVHVERVGDYEIQLFARRTEEPYEFAVMTNGRLGFIISRTSSATELPEVARFLAETTEADNLATHPEFDVQLAHFTDFPGFLFIDMAVTSAFYQERLGEQMDTLQSFVLDEVRSSVLSLGGGARLDENQLTFRSYLSVTPEIAEMAASIDAPTRDDAHLERFLHPSTMFALRTGVNLPVAWSTTLHFQGEVGARALRRRVAPFEEALQAQMDEDLTHLLTGQIALTINRLSLLSLLQGDSFADWADALNLIVVAQLADRARAIELLDGLVQREPEAYQRIDEGELVRYTCSQEESCFGNLLIVEDLLILAPDRVRRAAVSMASSEGTGNGELSESARALLASPITSGFFIDFSRIVGFTTILNYPQVVRDLLGLVDTLVVQLETSGNGVVVNGQLSLTEAE